MNRIQTCALCGMLAACAAARGQLPRGYEIVDLTSNNGVNERNPRINNRGDVVFFTHPPDQRQGELFLYERATNTVIQLTDDNVFDAFPDIADDGTIAWTRFIGPPDRYGPTGEIFIRTPEGMITRITDDEWHDDSPSINNHRQFVWKKYGPLSPCGLESMDLFTWDGFEISRLTTSGAEFGYANQGAKINDAGQIVWTEYDFCDPPSPYNFTSRTMLHSGGQTRSLPLIGVAPQVPDINEGGAVVWMGFDPVLFRDTVEFWDGARTTLLTDDGANPSLNDSGHLSFNRWYPTNRVWQLWLYRDGEFVRISHDLVHNADSSINNRSEIVWSHGLSPDLDVQLMLRFALGDVNCDGAIDAFDIEPFILALVDPLRYGSLYPTCDPALADINGDASVDAFDIEPFIEILVP